MPFYDDEGRPLERIELSQRPADSRFFQLVRGVRYREPGARLEWVAPAHDVAAPALPGNRTDLASVPPVFWSFLASYGRQSAPALVHDAVESRLAGLPAGEAIALRRAADRAFRLGLREQKVPLLRAWLMWGVVSVGRWWRVRR